MRDEHATRLLDAVTEAIQSCRGLLAHLEPGEARDRAESLLKSLSREQRELPADAGRFPADLDFSLQFKVIATPNLQVDGLASALASMRGKFNTLADVEAFYG